MVSKKISRLVINLICCYAKVIANCEVTSLWRHQRLLHLIGKECWRYTFFSNECFALNNGLIFIQLYQSFSVENGAIELLCQLTHKYDISLRLNGVWGLMNMAFQSDQRIKVQIITQLGADQIFRLLSDSDINVVMKTLGLLRNLVTHKSQIDHVMNLYGK